MRIPSPLGPAVRLEHLDSDINIGQKRPVEIPLRYRGVLKRVPLCFGGDYVEEDGADEMEGGGDEVRGDGEAVADSGAAVVAC